MLVCKILEPKEVIFAVEDNKRAAIRKFNNKINTKKYPFSVRVAILKSSYPQGAEKQLIYNTTARKVPAGKLPFEVGVVVHNIATLYAIYEAVYAEKPLVERVVTFAGSALKEPKNLRLRVGTLIEELFAEGILEFKSQPQKIILGGPMMGIAIDGMDWPITKTTSGVLFFSKEEVARAEEDVCIRCSRCVDACPMELLPLAFAKFAKAGRYGKAKDFFVQDCIECGSCAYVCPAKIPLVNYVKTIKYNLKKK